MNWRHAVGNYRMWIGEYGAPGIDNVNGDAPKGYRRCIKQVPANHKPVNGDGPVRACLLDLFYPAGAGTIYMDRTGTRTSVFSHRSTISAPPPASSNSIVN